MNDNSREATVEYVEIDGNRAGQRLDNFLAGRLRGVPKPLIYRILRTGQVRVNKGRVKPGYKLEAGDIVRIPPVRRDEAPLLDSTGLQKVAQSLQRAVLLENAGFIVLNKPAGLAVHGGSGLRYGLIEVLKATQGSYAGLELVHRLDRVTSGCLLLAKTRSCLNQLHTLLREHKIEKHYTALLDGVIGKPLTIDTALVRRKQSGEHMVAVLENDEERNKTALTHINPLRIYAGRTLADIQIETGRTHQIRVHCASIGHPLAGDEKYGHREFNKVMRGVSLRRLFLHAASLRFTLDKTYYIEAPLPEELAMVLDNLDA
jgi:23S rRNA pseudouridine955/2504/2580 synthase